MTLSRGVASSNCLFFVVFEVGKCQKFWNVSALVYFILSRGVASSDCLFFLFYFLFFSMLGIIKRRRLKQLPNGSFRGKKISKVSALVHLPYEDTKMLTFRISAKWGRSTPHICAAPPKKQYTLTFQNACLSHAG